MALLKVSDLRVSFPTSDGVVQAVRGLSYEVEAGQTLGIVGESGSGKSVSALTMLGLNPGADIEGSITFDGKDLLGMSEGDLRKVRGDDIAMVFQDPLSCLHPQYRVGWQIVEAIREHTDLSKSEARARTIDLFRAVKIPEPERRIDAYPHELSGGMRQRVMIAMALALKPKLLIADEPTTALDATVQAQLLDLLTTMQRDTGMAMIMITHDLGVVASIADSVLVMYAGRAAEFSDARTLFYKPHHPYTLGLLRSIPTGGGDERLVPIVGQPPSLINPPRGCAFSPRCPFAMDRCVESAPPQEPATGPNHLSACYLPPEYVGIDTDTNAARLAFADEHRTSKSQTLAGVEAAARNENV